MSGYVWNYTIDDSSSVFRFLPHGDGGSDDFIQLGWQPFYSISGFNKGGGDSSAGNSLHITSFPGASVGLDFSGTAIYLFGTTNGSYTVSVDNNPATKPTPDPSANVLFAQEGLSPGSHFVNLTALADANQNQTMSFDGATVTTVLDQTTLPVPVVFQNTNTSLTYTGNWSVDRINNIPSAANPAPYHETSVSGASVSLEFGNAVGVAINGTRNWGNWIYNVSLDGVLSSYNGSTMWLIGDALLFYANDLDPSTNHTIEMTNTAGGMNLWLNTITVFTANSSSVNGTNTTASPSTSASLSSSSTPAPSASVNTNPVTNSAASKKTPTGDIVGGVVGGVAALILVVAAVVWFITKKRAAKAPDTTPYPPILAGADSPYSSGNDVSFSGSGRVAEKFEASLRVPAPPPPTITIPPRSYEPPSSVTQSPPPQAQPPVDVDRIIELIAQRIDRAPPASAPADTDAPPPQYPNYAQ
ncbi:hypothetical protein CERSUDRAFT_102669 [Gelatoporia subvermispora B]|uniref:Uncharacterized protein n=1 Tax=Ceriporiopsis subvermispora (strain B) TaxID=914234 RepID=M2RV22_CERS8|nr:hypothetical protein CERSUDRAFT_102669 [Gelatoporia subvermispora B]